MQETCVQSLGREDPLEEEMASHISILAWEFHEQRGMVGYSPWGSQRVRHDLAATNVDFFFTVFIKGAYLPLFLFCVYFYYGSWLVDT